MPVSEENLSSFKKLVNEIKKLYTNSLPAYKCQVDCA